MNNIFNQNLSPIEKKLQEEMALKGVCVIGSSLASSTLFSEDCISCVWVSFNHAKSYLKDFAKAVVVGKASWLKEYLDKKRVGRLCRPFLGR